MAAESPVLIRPDDPVDVGQAPRFNGTTLQFDEFCRPLSSPLLLQRGQVIPSATPGQRIYNLLPTAWYVTRFEATLDGAASAGDTVVQVWADGVLAATLTVPAGQLSVSAAVSVTVARAGWLQARVTAAGAGARDLSVQFAGVQVVQPGAYSAAQSLPMALYDAEAGQPKNVGYVQLNGTAGDNITTPDSPQLDITGDIEIVARVRLNNWASPPAGSSWFINKHGLTTGGGYGFRVLNSGVFQLNWSTGAAGLSISSAAHGLTSGVTYWVKATLDVDNGASGNTVTFYWAADQANEPTSWTQIGSPVVTAGVTSIGANTLAPTLGTWYSGTGGELDGRLYRVIVRNGIGGATVADFDARNCYGPGYLNPGTLPVDGGGSKYVPLARQSGDAIWTSDKPGLRITGDVEMVARVALDDWTPAAEQAIVGKYETNGNLRSYYLGVQTNGTLNVRLSADGAAAIAPFSSVALPATDGTTYWVKATVDVDNGAGGITTRFYYAADQPTEPSSWTQLGSDVITAGAISLFAGGSYMVFGAFGNTFGGFPAGGRFYRAIIRSGIGGATVADFNAAQADTFGQATDGYGNGWLIALPKHHGNWTLAIPKIYDTSGTGKAPATFGAGSNQPKWLPWDGASSVYVEPSATIPIILAAGPSPFGASATTVRIDLDVALDSYTGAASILSRLASAEFYCQIVSSGQMQLTWYDGTNAVRSVTGPSIGWVAGKRYLLGYEVNSSTGVVSFYVNGALVGSASSGFTGWRTNVGASMNWDLGVNSAGTVGPGKRYTASLKYDGVEVARFDASLCGQTGYTDPVSGRLWSVQRATTGAKPVVQSVPARTAKAVIQLRTDDWIDVPGSALPPMKATDNFSISLIYRQWATPVAFGRLFSTQANSASAAAGVYFLTNVDVLQARVADGVTLAGAGSPGDWRPAVREVASLVVTGGGQTLNFYRTGLLRTVSAAPVGDRSSPSARIGANLNGTSCSDLDFESLVIHGFGMGPNIHAALTAGYNGGQ